MLFPMLLLAATLAAPHIRPSAGPFDLKGARFGMSLKEWRALPYPGSGSRASRAKSICSIDPSAGSTGLNLVANKPAGTIVCAYASQYGRYFLPEPVDLTQKYPARRLRYYFQQGRLVRIEYHLSANAYDPLVGDFDARYGPAIKLVRDTVRTDQSQYSRVVRTWAAAGLSVEIVDPVPPAYDLSLSFISTAPHGATAQTSPQLSAAPPAGSD